MTAAFLRDALDRKNKREAAKAELRDSKKNFSRVAADALGGRATPAETVEALHRVDRARAALRDIDLGEAVSRG